MKQKRFFDTQQSQVAQKGWTYFIQGEDGGNIKIGWTGRPIQKRLSDFSTGSPVTLRVVGAIPETVAPKHHEKHLHRKFARFRVDQRREWFTASEELLDYIRGNSTISCWSPIGDVDAFSPSMQSHFNCVLENGDGGKHQPLADTLTAILTPDSPEFQEITKGMSPKEFCQWCDETFPEEGDEDPDDIYPILRDMGWACFEDAFVDKVFSQIRTENACVRLRTMQF